MERLGIMNKKEIVSKLKELELDLEEVIVISGASLVMQDVIDSTNDIDLSCSKVYYDKIKWPEKVGAFNVEIKYYDVFEISYNLYYPDKVVMIDGVKFLNLEECLKIKENLNREKDIEIISKLRKRLIK